jgi:hypothetical protein
MRVINIDIKPPNMIVKIEDSQQTSAVGASAKASKPQQKNLDPKPLFIDCGDPNYVLNVDTVPLDVKNNDKRYCLIFLQQLIFFEFLKRRYESKLNYFIPSYSRYFVDKTSEVQKRLKLLDMILKRYDYNFTLIHYSLESKPEKMVSNCFELFEKYSKNYVNSVILQENYERNPQQTTAGGKATRSRRTDAPRAKPY